ncbi:MAG: tetratricopeptide repeat protein [Chitinispirillaceae bacterium]|nr:tetratricopeptide repeat protein [Chitinispirillaceae bacterium]
MGRFNLSDSEVKLIRKVLGWSIFASILFVGGAWLYFRWQLNQKNIKKQTVDFLDGSNNVLPIDIEAHRAIAARYMQIGAAEKALPHLKRLHALFEKDHEITRELARAALEAGDYQQALGYYDILLAKMEPDSVTATQCAQRGVALYYLNRVEESREALLECVERSGNNAEAYCFLGQIEANRELPSEKALGYLNRSISLDSSYTEAWYQLGRYYMQQKVYTKARELYQAAVAINPFHSKSHSRLGMVYYYLDYPELAKKSYRTALALNPDDFNTHYNLGELLYGVLGDTVEALKEFKRAVELNPSLFEAAFKIGLICMKNGMIKEAIRSFEQALGVAPGDVRILLQCAVAYEMIGRKDKAAELYRTIVSVDELNSIARQKLKLLAQP